jgi:ferrochelatase
MIEQSDHPIGALLLTFGSPATLEDVPAYMARVRGAKDVPADLVAEFRRRYEVVGGSPLIAITEQQADALAAELRRRYPSGPQFRVGIGMRHSPPYIEDAIGELAAAGVSEIAAVIMSPQYSPSIMGGYHRAVEAGIAAAVAAGYAVTANVAGAWNLNPHFLDALAERLREALSALPPEVRDTAPVLLTCHSLPKRVVEKEPGYLTQIDQTVIAIVERVGLAANRWQFAYQSAGHTPEEWLTPDMKDLLPGLRARGHRHVVMVPVQFLADHLEILYDIDVAAREDAERQGITLHRIESLNLSPSFIAALADVVEETSPSLVELAVDQAKR